MVGHLTTSEHAFVETTGKELPVHSYARIMRNVYGRPIVDAALLEVEIHFGMSSKDLKGREIHNWLIKRGYGKDTSREVLNMLIADADLMDDLSYRGFTDEWINDISNYRDRMRAAGLSDISYYMKYMLDEEIAVSPLIPRRDTYEVPDEPRIPEEVPVSVAPIQIVYRMVKFQVQASMSVSYAQKKGRHLEIFGEFWTLKDDLDVAVDNSIILLNDYAFAKGYGALVDAGWKYNGLVEDLDSFIVYTREEIDTLETEAKIWIDDNDFSRFGRFSDTVTLMPLWWTNDNIGTVRRILEIEVQL